MKSENVRPAERLLNRLGCLNETLLIARARNKAEINIQTAKGWRWIVGVDVDLDRFTELLQTEIDECVAQLAAMGVEMAEADERATAAANVSAMQWVLR